jgi:predicted nucleic-acid-binding Zn-ribbon protein
MTEQNEHTSLNCLRCARPITFVGTREFHEGPGGGLFSDLTELFMKKEKFDVYTCQNCGHVEFFVNSIGEQVRHSE